MNKPGDGFDGQKTTVIRDCVRRYCVSVDKSKFDCDIDATDGRGLSAPARQKMEENEQQA